jgi:hypothetical protein
MALQLFDDNNITEFVDDSGILTGPTYRLLFDDVSNWLGEQIVTTTHSATPKAGYRGWYHTR